ncbi:complement C1q tumor necrosis factor-related protein 2-like [Saccostrea cucullata]|uniref:complement C1q tumor necrosis factor-related protein 2-like n=1 Tax=Saccostrea cuccullata TaxID=36930 RepID=UPI002ED21D39
MFGRSIKKSTSPIVLLKENPNVTSSSSFDTKSQIYLKSQQNCMMYETKHNPNNLLSSHKSNPFQNKTNNSLMEKRLLTGVHTTKPPFADGVAFSVYVSKEDTDIAKDQSIKFDSIVSNIGNHYNPLSGIFIAPQHGIYVFKWNLYCHTNGLIYSQIVHNSNVVGATLTTGQGSTNVRTTTGVVVVEVNQGDVVFVRTHPTQGHIGNLCSSHDLRSSFTGWKIY